MPHTPAQEKAPGVTTMWRERGMRALCCSSTSRVLCTAAGPAWALKRPQAALFRERKGAACRGPSAPQPQERH